MKWVRTTLNFAVIGFSLLSGPPLAAQAEWEIDLVLYGWLAGTEGTMGIARQEVPVEANFGDVAQYVDFSFGGHFERRGPIVTLIGDIFYANLGTGAQLQDTTLTGEVDYRQWFFEGAAAYRLTEFFEILAAARFYDINAGLTVGEESVPKRHQVWADIFLGARYRRDLGQKWLISIRADLGAGGSNLAWFGNALLGYSISEQFSLSLGYRILSQDYESGSGGSDFFKWDVITNGLGIGVGYRF